MTTTALVKPVRVIQELSSTEQFIRGVERAKQIRDAARARLDAEFVERVEEARSRHLMPAMPEEASAPAELIAPA